MPCMGLDSVSGKTLTGGKTFAVSLSRMALVLRIVLQTLSRPVRRRRSEIKSNVKNEPMTMTHEIIKYKSASEVASLVFSSDAPASFIPRTCTVWDKFVLYDL